MQNVCSIAPDYEKNVAFVLFILQIDFMVKTYFPFWQNTRQLSNFMVK